MQGPALAPIAQKPERPARREPSKEELEEVRFAFDTLVAGSPNGRVSPKQIKVALRAMGFPVKKADVVELLRRQGEEESASVDYEVFMRVVSEMLSTRTYSEDLQRAFHLLDVHGVGKIDLPSLRKTVKSLGLEVPESELVMMISEFDKDHDGMIDLKDFMAIMAHVDE
ncbi:hypothetical protein QJQ45_026098 [Haematococcus lacustris]|nr:hypothetical protein QJQ45_026098 [Haematococcus lacustris]